MENTKKKDFESIEVERYEAIVKVLDQLHNKLISTDFYTEERKDYTQRYNLLRSEFGQLKHLYDMFKYKINDKDRPETEKRIAKILTLFENCKIVNKGKVIKIEPQIMPEVIDLYSHLNWKIQLVR